MDGIVTFYINVHPESGADIEKTLELFRIHNKDMMDDINTKSGYRVMVVPTVKEGCRVEKIDFDKPFPRYLPKTHIDMQIVDKKQEERLSGKQKEELAESEDQE